MGLLAEFVVRKYRLHHGVSIKDLAEVKMQKDEWDVELFSARNGKEKILDYLGQTIGQTRGL